MSKNKMILFLSLLYADKEKGIIDNAYTYLCPKGKPIKATQTNEAATKYFIRYLKEQDQALDEIIIIATKEVMTEKINNEITTKDYFENVVYKWCEELNVEKKPTLKIIKTYNENTDEIKIGELLVKIIDELDNDDNIYLDSTGGFRNTSNILMLLIKITEYINTHTKIIVYSQYYKDKSKENVILDVTSTYNMYDLLNGINEFARFGSNETLKNYFNKSNNEDVLDLISKIGVFFESIKLCKINELANNIRVLREAIDKVENTDSNEHDVVLLRSLMPFVRKKFFIGESDKFDMLGIIKWCVSNSLIQQALTIYVEKIPKFLYDNKILTISEALIAEYNDKCKSYESIYAKIFYENIMNN